MKNSIKRDIHLLESYAGMTHKMNDNQGRPKLDQAIEHILSDYKRVLKENERLQKENEELGKFITEGIEIKTNSPYKDYSLEFLRNNFIPVQKVKDILEQKDKIIDLMAKSR